MVRMQPEPAAEEEHVVDDANTNRRSISSNNNGAGSEFSINDNVDILAEILGRLDGRSLGVAGCVCRLWHAVSRRDAVWEAVCFRHVSGGRRPPASIAAASSSAGSAEGNTRSVVAALGGYRRLYRLCVGPALDRLAGSGRSKSWIAPPGPGEVDAGHLSLSLSMSLFSIDCYERLLGGGGSRPSQRPASLLFLCNPVDVS